MIYIGTAIPPKVERAGSPWDQKNADPIWNYTKGEVVRISCFTNCKEVELFLNDKSLGKKTRADFEKSGVMSWTVPFEPGTLKAVAMDALNKSHVSIIKTAGKPSTLLVSSDTKQLSIAKRGIAHIELSIVDEAGNPVFISDNNITCTINGSATLLGLENSNPRDITSYKTACRKIYKGKLVAYIQAGTKEGDATVTFSSPGIKSAKVVFNIVK
jgi:hypothetical protein